MKCYFGEVHSHTTESDGKGGSPRDAYIYARDVGKADYFAVTDHNTQLKEDRFLSLMPPLADEMNEPGKFAALYGYEMTYHHNTGYYGHLNILGSKSVDYVNLKLREWYDVLEKKGEDVIGQFNHPGEKWGDFEEFSYNAEMDKIFDLIELRIEEYSVPVIEDEYERCLSKGWHVGPVSNEDTHGADWTTCREEIGAVLAEQLDREHIIDAMRAHRTYATSDRSFHIFYRANGQWLGSILPKSGKLCIEVEASTEKECGLGILQAVGEHNTVLAQIDLAERKSFCWQFEIPDDHKYVYIRRTCGREYAVTAPVWVEQPNALTMDLQYGFDKDGVRLEGSITNNTQECIEDLRLRLFCGNGRLRSDEAVTVNSDFTALLAGETKHISLSVGFDYASYDLVAECCGELDRLAVRASQRFYTCPLTVDRFFPNTNQYSSQRCYSQPFCCFDIQNLSMSDCDLSQYVFRFYQGAGLDFKDFTLNRVLGGGETLTVWMRGQRQLDANDFNRAFGTKLTEGKELVAVDIHMGTDVRRTRKLLICRGDRTARRVWIQYGEMQGVAIPSNGAVEYLFDGKSSTGEVRGVFADAKPGDTVPQNIRRFSTNAEYRVQLFAKCQESIGNVICLCDGADDAESLQKDLARFGGVSGFELLTGNNDGKEKTSCWFAAEGDGLLCKAARSDADTVALCIGGYDCGKKRVPWLTRNFLSLATLLEMTALYLKAKGKRVILLCPHTGREFAEDHKLLCRTLLTVSKTVDVPCNVDVKQLIPKPFQPDFEADIVPKKGALKIACVGDLYTQGFGITTPYPQYLQKLLGDCADVRVFAADDVFAAEGKDSYLVRAAKHVRAIEAFRPDVAVIWLCMNDLKTMHCRVWDSDYRARYMRGFCALAEKIRATGAKLIVVSPFCRKLLDIRMEILLREGDGMAATVRELAEMLGAEHIDLVEATKAENDYVTVGKEKVNYLSEAGNLLLANAVVQKIESK